MKKFTNLIIGAVVLAGLLFFIKTAMTPEDTGPVLGMDTVAPDDWVKGASESATLLVEYSDFQCPACAGYHPIVQRLLEEKGDDFQFVYRHYPLPQHQNARLAAQASEAAGLQGRFWEMHDLLFTRQDQWSEEGDAEAIFSDYAIELELDMDQFGSDLQSNTVKQQVDGDYASGNAARVNSTPSFYLNGEKISTPRSYEDFAALLDTAIQEHPNSMPEASEDTQEEPTVIPNNDESEN